MATELTLRATMWTDEGPALTHDHPIMFEVLGLPAGHRASIAKMPIRWQILHYQTPEDQSTWQGHHETKEDALAELHAAISPKQA